MNNNQKIIITGENGDVGSHIFKLYKENEYKIYPFKNKNIDKKIDRILHLAAKSPPASTDDILKSNISYLQKIIKYAEKNEINEFIFFSAISVYGEQNKEDLSEDDCLNSPNIYGCSKLLGERILKNSSLKVLCIRFPAILGYKNTTNLLSRLYVQLKKNECITLTNHNRLFNNFISIENIFDFLTNIKISKQYDILNIASNKDLTLFEIVTLMKNLLHSKSEIVLSKHKTHFFNISNDKAISEYGFKPHDSTESIKRWMRQRQVYEKNI